MMNKHDTLVRWFGWFGWFPGKLEVWLEAQAAQGWHLVKADRLVNRFRFQRGAPKTVRIYVDFPGSADDEYYTIFADAGWSLVDKGLGWHIWRMEYAGRRPEAVNDPQPLIERNRRLLIMLAAAFVAMLVQIPTQTNLGHITKRIFQSPAGKVMIALYVIAMVVLAAAIALTYSQIRKLKQQKP